MTTRINVTTGTGGARINSERTGLPSKAEREELYRTFRELYDIGMSDLQIAEHAGACNKTVSRWRYRENLPNIYGRYPTYGG